MPSWSLLCLWIVCVCLLCSGDFTEDSTSSTNYVIIETGSGKVAGRRQGPVNSFLGIPYAEKPTGRFRFRPPRPKVPWYPALYQALNYGPECLQSTLYYNNEDSDSPQIPMDEDCLYLNIWQPSKTSTDKLYPVMIWIYGGAFIHGSASKAEYEGSRLAARRNGAIVVSLNYRLGALGFLVSTADGLYGNYGLADQKIAIQWVKDNIRSFGGDPNRITLFGESAGAMSIGLHMLDQEHRLSVEDEVQGEEDEVEMEEVHGHGSRSGGGRGVLRNEQKLFHSVILQSNPLGYKYRSVAVANFIGTSYKEYLDCEDLRCLQSESAEELIHVQDTLMAVPRSIGDFFTWGPVATDQAYFREVRLRPGPLANVTVRQPIEALQAMRRLSVPVLIGTNSHEGTVFVFTAYPTRMAKFVFQALVFSFFRLSAPRVLRMYAPLTKMLSRSAYPDYRLVLSRIIGDYLFKCPNSRFASLLAGAGAAVFHYEFALPTRTPGFPCCDGLSCHTCELPYVFNQMGVIESDYSYQDANKNIPHIPPTTTSHTTHTTHTTPPAPPPTTPFSTATSPKPTNTHTIAAESVGGAPAGSKGGVVDGFISTDWDNLPDSPLVGGRNTNSDSNSGGGSSVGSGGGNSARYTDATFPDIFGAAAPSTDSVYTRQSGSGSSSGGVYSSMHNTLHSVYNTINNMYKSRNTIDSEVSGLMSDYWTTFATYGDPNGQPSTHKSGPANGYVAGTRVDSLPWWPRLLGDLPVPPPVVGEEYEVISGSGDDSGVGSGDSNSNLNDGDVSGEDDTTHYSDPLPSIIPDHNIHTTTPDYAIPVIHSAVGRGTEDTTWATARVQQSDSSSIGISSSSGTGNGLSGGTSSTKSNRRGGSINNHHYTPSAQHLPLQLNTHLTTLQQLSQTLPMQATKYAAPSSAQYMHQMVFDEASSVNIIQNDCLCDQWNELQYRF